MATLPLKIFIHGLIALAPGPNRLDRNSMTALVIDGSHPPESTEVCMQNHRPVLSFILDKESSPKCGKELGCELSGFQCICGLDGLKRKEITLELESDPPLTPIVLGHSAPSREVPQDATEAGSFSYVPNLSAPPIGLSLNDDYLTSPEPPSLLLTRFIFPFQTATACSLVAWEDRGVANLRSLAYRRIGQLSRAGDYSAAMAQRVAVEVSVSEGSPVRLRFRKLDGTQEVFVTLDPRKHGYRIDISNEPDAPLAWNDPCDDGIARHFVHFYGLAKAPPAHPESYLIPHLLPTLHREAAGMEPVACLDPDLTPASHPICPVASFFDL